MMIEIEIEAVERFERARAQEAQQQLRQSMARQVQQYQYAVDNVPTCMHGFKMDADATTTTRFVLAFNVAACNCEDP